MLRPPGVGGVKACAGDSASRVPSSAASGVPSVIQQRPGETSPSNVSRYWSISVGMRSTSIGAVCCPLTVALPVVGGDALPVVGAERDGRQAGVVVEVAHRVVRPGVADGDGLLHLVAADDDRVAVDLGVGPVPLLVLAGDGEALH